MITPTETLTKQQLINTLDNHLDGLRKYTDELIKRRSTLNERTGIKANVIAADKVVDIIKEYHLPKLTTAADISAVDNKVTEVLDEIRRVKRLMETNGSPFTIMDDYL